MRSHYYRRIFSAYMMGGASQLNFWHDQPQATRNISPSELGEYYMPFIAKANYPHVDVCGIPKLNYRGTIGWQYNPIAVAQHGLGHHTLFRRTGRHENRDRFLIAAGWLIRNLERNQAGLYVWNHHFDWEYRSRLKAPWCSGLAQGQGISLLVRAYRETRDEYYLEAAQRAFLALSAPVESGGMLAGTGQRVWIEEYIVDPPTHILNGCLWASWGLYDYWLATGDQRALALFRRSCSFCGRPPIGLRHRILVALRAIRHAHEDAGKPVLSPVAHRAARGDGPSHRESNVRKFRAQMEWISTQRIKAWLRVPA